MSTALQPVVDETIEAVSGPPVDGSGREIAGRVTSRILDISSRDNIEEFEAELLKLPQVVIPVAGCFSGGIYAREILIPADTVLTGRVYKDDHFEVMAYGDITVSSDAGTIRLRGFNILPAVQGKKRIAYAHKETKWLTFCASSEQADDDAYLDHLTCATFDDLVQVLAEREAENKTTGAEPCQA